MAIAFDAAGTPATGTSALTVTIPAGATLGSVMVLSVVSTAGGAANVTGTTGNTGWTVRDHATDAGGSPEPTVTVLWKACGSGDPGASVTCTFAATPATTVGVVNTYTGVDTVTPFEASAAAFDATGGGTAHVSPTIVTTQDTDWILTAFGDRSGSTWTPPAGFTERSDTSSGSVASLETADSNGTVAHGSISETATGSVSTSTDVMWIGALQVPAAAGAAPPRAARRTDARTPALPAQRRYRQAPVPAQDGPLAEAAQRRQAWPRAAVRRGRVTAVVPKQLNPPYPFAETVQRRQAHPRALLRRGRQANVIPPQLNPPYPVAELRQQRQPRGLWPRRGHGFTPVPAQQGAAPNPPWVQQPLRRARLAAAVTRRRAPLALPGAQDVPLPGARHPRTVPASRRGRIVQAPQAQAAAPAPAWVQQPSRHARLAAAVRRRPAAAVPAVQDVPLQAGRHARIGVPSRRARAVQAPQVQGTVPAPAWVQPHRSPLRALPLTVRRGKAAWAPAAQEQPVAHRGPLRAVALIRRRLRQLFPWPQATAPSFTVGILTAATQSGSSTAGTYAPTGASSTSSGVNAATTSP